MTNLITAYRLYMQGAMYGELKTISRREKTGLRKEIQTILHVPSNNYIYRTSTSVCNCDIEEMLYTNGWIKLFFKLGTKLTDLKKIGSGEMKEALFVCKHLDM